MGFKVSGGPLFLLPLAAEDSPPKTDVNYLPRAVMMASATFFGASL